jgi:exodeoxyribonuclease (lambda-induced)
MIVHTAPQGSPEWLEARRGCITGSRFKDARDYKALTKADEKAGKTRGEPSAKQLGYAFDVARELVGGKAPDTFRNAAMRFGTEQEPIARAAYESRTGAWVDEAGFITTDDGRFGVSVDGLVGDDGIIEIKTVVSSDTLFTAVVDGDISAYRDQCLGAMWLLGRQWVDLVLWAPDLACIGRDMTIIRITRDDDAINALEADLVDFMRRVDALVKSLRSELVEA